MLRSSLVACFADFLYNEFVRDSQALVALAPRICEIVGPRVAPYGFERNISIDPIGVLAESNNRALSQKRLGRRALQLLRSQGVERRPCITLLYEAHVDRVRVTASALAKCCDDENDPSVELWVKYEPIADEFDVTLGPLTILRFMELDGSTWTAAALGANDRSQPFDVRVTAVADAIGEVLTLPYNGHS